MIVAAVVFDPTITFGTVVEIGVVVVSVVGAYYAWKQQISVQLAEFKGTLSEHTRAINDHASRFGRYEQEMKDVSGTLQRLIGRLEYVPERRKTARD